MFDPTNYREVEQWTIENLQRLPDSETDQYEYKGSGTRKTALAEELWKAASAFWNSAGGIFLAGVNDTGIADGGLDPSNYGRQSIRDWADQQVARVVPPGPYSASLIQGACEEPHRIDDGHSILVVGFGDSPIGRHQAPNCIYYYRHGALSVPAPHHVVELLGRRARPDLRLRVEREYSARRPPDSGLFLILRVYMSNIGGRAATHVCLTMKSAERWSVVEAETAWGALPFRKVAVPVGWWKRVTTPSGAVIYPGDEYYVGRLVYPYREDEPFLENRGAIELEYSTVALDAPEQRGIIRIDTEDILLKK